MHCRGGILGRGALLCGHSSSSLLSAAWSEAELEKLWHWHEGEGDLWALGGVTSSHG